MSGKYSNPTEATYISVDLGERSSTLPLEELPQPRFRRLHPDAVLQEKHDYVLHTKLTTRTIKYIKPNLEDNHVIQRVPKQNEEIAEKTRQKEE